MQYMLRSLLYFCVLFFLACGPVQARQWNATPQAMAQEYLIIQDARANNEVVILFWVAPELVPVQPGAEAAKAILAENLVLAAAHMHVDNQGRFTSKSAQAPAVKTFAGTGIAAVDKAGLSPAAIGAIEMFKSVFSQALGPLGQRMNWYVFDGKGVSSCLKGGLSVLYAGTEYTYETPIPGCP